MIGFVVCFEIADPRPGYGHASVCAWSGWAASENGKRKLKMRWILSTGVFDPSQEWGGTLIGDDKFELIAPDPDDHYLDAPPETLHQFLIEARG